MISESTLRALRSKQWLQENTHTHSRGEEETAATKWSHSYMLFAHPLAQDIHTLHTRTRICVHTQTYIHTYTGAHWRIATQLHTYLPSSLSSHPLKQPFTQEGSWPARAWQRLKQPIHLGYAMPHICVSISCRWQNSGGVCCAPLVAWHAVINWAILWQTGPITGALTLS